MTALLDLQPFTYSNSAVSYKNDY